MPVKFLVSVLLVGLFFQGCTSLFFYPDKTTYKEPSDYGLEYKDIYFKSIDKTSLHAWHIYTKLAEPKGLVFVAHGNAQNLSSHFTSWVWLIEEGYELFIFDYREYGKSEGKSDLKGSIEDTRAALDYLEGMYKGPFVVCGQSLGGTLLLNALQDRNNTQVQAVVIDSAFTGFGDIASQKMDGIWFTWPFQWIPYLTLDTGYDAKDKVAKINKPFLFLHGSLDRVISANASWELFELSSWPKELWIVKDAQHIQSLENENVQKSFLEFLHAGSDYYDVQISRMKIYK